MNKTGGVPGGNHWPSKPKAPPVRIVAALILGSMQQVLYAAAAAVTPPSDCPDTPTAPGSTAPASGPGAADRLSIDVITNEMSPGCCSESLRSAPPGYAVLVPGKSGAATT